MATRYRFSMVLAFLCSVMVGALWAGNITALYPMVEIVFRGESTHDWAENRVQQDQERFAKLSAQIEELETGDGKVTATSEPNGGRELQLLRAQLGKAEYDLASARFHERYIKRLMPGEPYKDLLIVVIAVIIGTLLKSFFLVCNMMLVARISANTSYDLQDQLFQKTIRHDLAMHGKYGSSDILSRCTHYVRVLEGGIGVILGKAVREPLKMLACLVGAALISWQLLLLCLAVTPVGLLVLRRISKAMKKSSGNNLQVVSEIYQRLWESFNCIKAVKAFTTEDFEHKRFLATGREYVRRKMRMALFRSLFRPTTEVGGIVVVGLAILFGAHLVLNQTTQIFGLSMGSRPLSPGALMVFFGMLAGIAEPIRKMSEIYGSVIAAASASDRIYDLIDKQPNIQDPERPKLVPHPHTELSFRKVEFHYRKKESVLKKIDLQVSYGETVVLLGPNGCGKSTLLNLVPRFYDPIQGQVRLDGIDLREIQIKELRKRIGVVTQETLLFADTIANNIRYGTPDSSDEMVIEAARQARAHEFIEQLSSGYNTFIGQDGGHLSGGQRQRISLARAILRDPEILILDEATSQIDVESEKKMHESLKDFVRGRTSLIVSHRLSTLSLATRIVMMDGGQVIADGSHEELLQNCQAYRRLYQSHTLSGAA